MKYHHFESAFLGIVPPFLYRMLLYWLTIMRGGCSQFGGTHLVTELPAALLRQMPQLVTSATVWLIDHVTCDDKLVSVIANFLSYFNRCYFSAPGFDPFWRFCALTTDMWYHAIIPSSIRFGFQITSRVILTGPWKLAPFQGHLTHF